MDWTSNALLSTALALSRAHARAKPEGRALPPLLFLTDPERTPEPWRVVERLPEGAGVVFRAFGAADAVTVGRRLREVTRRRGLSLLAGAEVGLAEEIAADGLHLPERDVTRAPALLLAHPSWLVTVAAHSEAAVTAAAASGAHACLVSPVFASRSRSAGVPLGAKSFSALAAQAGLPVYALGGITQATAPLLLDSAACGLAAVEGISVY